MRKSNIFIWIIIILIIVILIIGFIPKGEKDIIKIGAILPLSGSLAQMGEETRNGIDLAVKDINSKYEKKIEIIYEDSQMDPKEGLSAINKLKTINDIKYVIVWGTPVTIAVQPITEESKIILMSGCISPFILEDKNYTLRIFYNLDQALDKFVGFIQEKKFSKVTIFYQNGEAFERQVQGLENKNIKFIIKEKFDSGEKDFRTMLFKIKDSKPDLIVLLGYGPHFPIIFKQIKEVGLEGIPILGGLDFLDVPKEELNLYENAVFVAPEFNVDPSAKSLNFIKDYETKFDAKPGYHSAYAYDITNLFYFGITNTDGDSQNVIDYIKNLKNYDGVVGDIEILSNGDTKSSLSFGIYKNGEIKKFEE